MKRRQRVLMLAAGALGLALAGFGLLHVKEREEAPIPVPREEGAAAERPAEVRLQAPPAIEAETPAETPAAPPATDPAALSYEVPLVTINQDRTVTVRKLARITSADGRVREVPITIHATPVKEPLPVVRSVSSD